VPDGANAPRPVSLLSRFLRFFFWHFYHGFAWTYDSVAAVVSIGRWDDWIRSVLPFVRGRRVLEVGHGPGHLQLYLRQADLGLIAGIDESPQMAHLASSRLRAAGYSSLNLARGLGQSLPFADGSFDTVVSTFPTEYIFRQSSMLDVKRVLATGGRFIVLPAAWIIGRKAADKLAAWLFRVTNQAPRQPAEVVGARLRAGFEAAGFSPVVETIEIRSSTVLVIVAE